GGGEGGEEILPAGLVEGPGAAHRREGAEPVVGRSAIGRRIGPDIPGSPCAAPVALRYEKPGVLRRAVVQNEVEDDANPATMRGVEQPVEIGEAAIDGIDGREVADVVTEIDLR